MKFTKSAKAVIKNSILLVIAVLSIISCKKDEQGTSKINIYLTDAPALFSGCNIEINSVSILTEKAKQEKVFDEINSGNYDLFKFSNGIDTLLASTELSPRKIIDIRIILGTNNYVFEDGVKKPLITDLTKPLVFYPDIKLNNKETLNLWLDIDAYRSIKKLNDGSIIFNPVFKFFEKKKTGAIRGIVLPANARTYVSVYNRTDTFSSVANEKGLFTVQGIKPGKYIIKFTPQITDFLEAVIEDSIEIQAQSSPYIGTVVLN